MAVTTECRRPGWGRLCALVLACAFAVWSQPRWAQAMASDGALITNVVSATYGGSGGLGGNTPQYIVSYNATSNVLISCPAVALSKVAMPTVQAAAGTVTFQIWVANASMQASAFNVVITDMLPNNLAYAGPTPGPFAWWWSAGPTVPGVTTGLSLDNVTFQSGAAIVPVVGQGSPYYLRWTIGQLAPGKSGFVTYMATVL